MAVLCVIKFFMAAYSSAFFFTVFIIISLRTFHESLSFPASRCDASVSLRLTFSLNPSMSILLRFGVGHSLNSFFSLNQIVAMRS